jgi:hypothetical protein
VQYRYSVSVEGSFSVTAMLLEIFVVAFLGSFLVLTLVYQIFTQRLLWVVWRWDVFRLLPNYRLFFAMPRDLRLYVRDRSASGALTAWREIPLWSERPWYQAVWHPQGLVPHVLSSLVEQLVTLAEAGRMPSDRLPKSVPYYGLWHCLRHLAPTGLGTERQFKIAEAHGYGSTQSARPVYTSEFHLL